MIVYKKDYNGEVEEILSIDKVQFNLLTTAAGGVVVNDKKEILLIQRSEDSSWPLQWEIPRGKCDKEIKIQNQDKSKLIILGLKREVKEETGLDVYPVRLIEKFGYQFPSGVHEQFIFLCSMKDPNQKVILSDEHVNYKWISRLIEARQLNVPQEIMSILSKLMT